MTDTRQIKGLKITPVLLDNIQNAAREEQFKVIFHKAKEYISDSKATLTLEGYFTRSDLINRNQIESLTGFGKTKTKYFIKKLLEEGYLEKIGNGPSTKYKKKRHQNT